MYLQPASPPPGVLAAPKRAELTGLSGYDVDPAYTLLAFIYVAATAAGAYHGYKRNDSVGWAIGWALATGLFPYIALPIAAAQGFGEPRRD